MRFLADECLLGEIVRQLREQGFDVATIPRNLKGEGDSAVLEHSVAEGRILLTQDYDFGDLAVLGRKSAIGIVIVAEDSFSGQLGDIAVEVVERLAQLGNGLAGNLTIVEARRVRQRPLFSPAASA